MAIMAMPIGARARALFAWSHVLACCLLSACAVGCLSPLPDDLPSLIQAMNSNHETTSVDATIKVFRRYGKSGLLQALREGRANARAQAAYKLRDCADKEVEHILIGVVSDDSDAFVRVRAVWTLEEIGSPDALPAIEQARRDPDPLVARSAALASNAIRKRSGAR